MKTWHAENPKHFKIGKYSGVASHECLFSSYLFSKLGNPWLIEHQLGASGKLRGWTWSHDDFCQSLIFFQSPIQRTGSLVHHGPFHGWCSMVFRGFLQNDPSAKGLRTCFILLDKGLRSQLIHATDYTRYMYKGTPIMHIRVGVFSHPPCCLVHTGGVLGSKESFPTTAPYQLVLSMLPSMIYRFQTV